MFWCSNKTLSNAQPNLEEGGSFPFSKNTAWGVIIEKMEHSTEVASEACEFQDQLKRFPVNRVKGGLDIHKYNVNRALEFSCLLDKLVHRWRFAPLWNSQESSQLVVCSYSSSYQWFIAEILSPSWECASAGVHHRKSIVLFVGWQWEKMEVVQVRYVLMMDVGWSELMISLICSQCCLHMDD